MKPLTIPRDQLDPVAYRLPAINALESGQPVLCAGVGRCDPDPITGTMFVFTPADNKKSKPRYFHTAARALMTMHLHSINYNYSKLATC